jgi:hypothetical protein
MPTSRRRTSQLLTQHRREGPGQDAGMDAATAQADAGVIRAAAAQLRAATIRDQHAGLTQPARAFHVCLVLDELAAGHVHTLPEEVRRVALDACQVITRET